MEAQKTHGSIRLGQRVLGLVRTALAEPEVVTELPTIAEYAEVFFAMQKQRAPRSWKDTRSILNKHILPRWGAMRLDEIEKRDVKEWLAEMRGRVEAEEMAPRTLRNIAGKFLSMLEDAEDDYDVPAPRIRSKKDLPKGEARPGFKPKEHVFTRQEMLDLIDSYDVPADRRVFWALLFLTGGRFGEIAAITWADWDREAEPLTAIRLEKGWRTAYKRLQPSTKTNVDKAAPVHPRLEAVLRAWLESGWEMFTGRAPTPEDLIVPRVIVRGPQRGELAHRNDTVSLRQFRTDCERLWGGKETRRQHDARKTFLSLLQADGGIREVFKKITHLSKTDVVDGYIEMQWSQLCAEVNKLQIGHPSSSAGLRSPLSTPSGSLAATAAAPSSSSVESPQGDPSPSVPVDGSAWPWSSE